MLQLVSLLLSAFAQLFTLIRERLAARRAADVAAVKGYARIQARITAAHAAARAAATTHGRGGGDEAAGAGPRQRGEHLADEERVVAGRVGVHDAAADVHDRAAVHDDAVAARKRAEKELDCFPAKSPFKSRTQPET